MLHDASANGVPVALLFLTSANGAESGERQDCYGKSFHKHVHFPDLQSITHEEGDANVQNGKNSEGITKWAVDDVPKLKDALRSAEKGDALGQRGLLLRHANGALEFLVAGGEQAEAG